MGANGGVKGSLEKLREYDGKGGAVVLTRWIEKMEFVHDMSGCSVDQNVKYTAGSFVCKALTWWNSQILPLAGKLLLVRSWNDFKFYDDTIVLSYMRCKKVESDGNSRHGRCWPCCVY
ncbi:hypothetical protein Tco_0403267 [Tanacetum coccineum]